VVDAADTEDVDAAADVATDVEDDEVTAGAGISGFCLMLLLTLATMLSLMSPVQMFCLRCIFCRKKTER
jgi:hypothetical protein